MKRLKKTVHISVKYLVKTMSVILLVITVPLTYALVKLEQCEMWCEE